MGHREVRGSGPHQRRHALLHDRLRVVARPKLGVQGHGEAEDGGCGLTDALRFAAPALLRGAASRRASQRRAAAGVQVGAPGTGRGPQPGAAARRGFRRVRRQVAAQIHCDRLHRRWRPRPRSPLHRADRGHGERRLLARDSEWHVARNLEPVDRVLGLQESEDNSGNALRVRGHTRGGRRGARSAPRPG